MTTSLWYALIAAGDETSLRLALQSDPSNEDAIVALADKNTGREP